MRTGILIGLTFVGLALAQGSTALGQGRGPGDREGDDRGSEGNRNRDRGPRGDWRGRGGPWGGGPWGGGGPRGNPEDRWRRFDHNDDGIIAPDELDERVRGWLRIDKPTKISDLVARLERERGQRENRDREDSNSDRGAEKPLVPGFGVDEDVNAAVPGFGPSEQPAAGQATTPAANTGSSPASSTNSGNAAPAAAVTSNQYVDGVFRERDNNGNGTLEGEEIAAAKGLPPNADKNGDGKITKEELLEATGSKPSKSTSAATNTSAKRSYRFASAHDRLPSSAKSWIVARDKDGDGQVAMHEFSSTWSDSKVREFQRYDKNGDGVVTAEEYLAR